MIFVGFLSCFTAEEILINSSVVAVEISVFALEFTAFSISASSDNPIPFAERVRSNKPLAVAVGIALSNSVFSDAIDVFKLLSAIY